MFRFQFRRRLHFQPLKKFEIQPHQYPLIFGILATAAAVITYDIYYYKYLREASPNKLEQDKFNSFILRKIIKLSPTTSMFRFSALDSDTCPKPSHVILKNADCQVARSYTPIYSKYWFDLVVKKYPDGLVSNYIHNLPIGSSVEMRGPIQTFKYEPNTVSSVSMLTGGTGVTVMYQLLLEILSNSLDKTRVSLVTCNKNKEEMLLDSELQDLAKQYPNRFVMYRVLEEAPEDWKEGVGYITEEIIKQRVMDGSFVVVCGNDGFMNHVSGIKDGESQGRLGGLLKKLNYPEDGVLKL